MLPYHWEEIMTDAAKNLPAGIPLRNITCQKLLRFETGENWYRVVAEGLVTAEVVHLSDAFLCRLQPDRGETPLGHDVVQLAIGRVRSRLADAIFSPVADLGFKFNGKNLCVEWDVERSCYLASAEGSLTVHIQERVYQDGSNLKWYKPMDKSVFSRAPAGWCSWYYYYLDVDEPGILRNLGWLKDNLAPYGLEYLQIDDGWQGRGKGFGSNRDWFTTCAEKFPHGMKWLAEQIRQQGLTPGIWLIPFTESDPQRYAADPAMFVHNADGKSAGELKAPLDYEWMPEEDRRYEWIGRYIVDPTNPKTQEYLKSLIKMICSEWGYDYVKIDGQGGMAPLYTKHHQRLYKNSHGGDEVYRAGLSAIRQAMGKERFLLNCGAGWDSAGLCDGIRIGGDVEANFRGLERALECTCRYLHFNNLLWWTDPDVVCVRPPLSLEQARAWATLLGITGQLLMTSDDMPALPAERIELLKRIYPVADIHPLELYPLWNQPGTFDLKVNKPGVGEWDVAAVFNWSRSWTKTGPLSAEMLGIPPSAKGYIFYDVWQEQVLGVGLDAVELSVAETSVRVVSIRAVEDHPQVIAASRHLTQGADDLEEVIWDEESGVLSGSSLVVAGDPYRLRFTVPEGWKVAAEEVEVKDGIGLLTLNSESNAAVDWQVHFSK
jgi:hypothetical protein